MNRRRDIQAVLVLLTLFALSSTTYAQIVDFGSGGAQVTPRQNHASPGVQQQGTGGGSSTGATASPHSTGMTSAPGGGEQSGSGGAATGNRRGVLYTLLPWIFVFAVIGSALGWLAGARGRKGQEATIHGEAEQKH